MPFSRPSKNGLIPKESGAFIVFLDQSKSDYRVSTRLGQGSNERIEGLKEGRAAARWYYVQ